MIKIITLDNKNEWYEYLKRINVNDIYFFPEYFELNQTIIKGKVECFVYEGKDVVILYPYIKRSIDRSCYFDISSGYGFGGYIGMPRNQGVNKFRSAFHRYCLENNIVSEFIRFHPLYNNHFLASSEIDFLENCQPVILADFCSENFNMKTMITKEAWKKIKKAERNKIEVSEYNTEIDCKEFERLYYKTMNRLEASKFYFFNEDFFRFMRKELASSSILFNARYQGEVVGGLWILFGKTFSYNFLSCSDADYANLGINDLLQWKALEWAYHSGKQKHLLGGGRKGEDSLFQFKAKFAPYRHNYYLGKIIHLSGVYEKLCERLNGFDSAERVQLGPMGWFPYYRGIDADNVV
jgi:hypothetical protein